MSRSASGWVWACLYTCCLGACLPAAAPAQQVSDIARDVNVATRFGRMDVAIEHTAEAHRQQFMQKRADWGTQIRILDVELANLELTSTDAAEVFVDVSWMRIDEGVLRSTRVKQSWQNPGGGWQLGAEQRHSGDVGLLGENVVVLRPEGPRDVHFPVKTIR